MKQKVATIPFPVTDDFVVPVAEWSARHVYNFICGVASWGSPIALLIGNKTIEIKKAISYSHETTYQKRIPRFLGEVQARKRTGGVNLL